VKSIAVPVLVALLALSLPGATRAGSTEQLLLRARHKQLVQGDLAGAERLYREALKDRSLGPGAQARVRVRIASCLVRRGRYDVAEPFLAERIYARDEVDPAVRRLAAELRARVRRERPPPRVAPPGDGVREKRARFDRYLGEARRALDRGENAFAYLRALMARELFPESAEAQALVAEIETRWSGAARFLADPLQWLRDWTETRITQVAARAGKLFREGVAHDGRGAYNLAEGRLREAVRVIDACESAGVSERLVALRRRIELYWREMRARTGRGPPDIAPVRRRASPTADYLEALQRMLDMVSSSDREYRLLPVLGRPGGAPLGWHRKPEGFSLLRSAPSRWTLAAFAREYLRRRVHPRTWSEPGNYLETAGGMLVARNDPAVLDALEEELRQLEKPKTRTLRARLLAVPVGDAAAAAFIERFGPFRRFDRGGSSAYARALPAEYSLDYVASFLRSAGATVHPGRDAFDVPVTNGAAQTFFLARPLRTAQGYGEQAKGEYGVLIDAFPYRAGARSPSWACATRSPQPAARRALSSCSGRRPRKPRGTTPTPAPPRRAPRSPCASCCSTGPMRRGRASIPPAGSRAATPPTCCAPARASSRGCSAASWRGACGSTSRRRHCASRPRNASRPPNWCGGSGARARRATS